MNKWRRITELQPENRPYTEVQWINIKEKLPHQEISYLVVLESGDRKYRHISIFSFFEGKFIEEGGNTKVTHWCPLPQLPKEENKNG